MADIAMRPTGLSSRHVARLVVGVLHEGEERSGKPLRVRVLPYMVKKVGIGRGCPTLIGGVLSSGAKE